MGGAEEQLEALARHRGGLGQELEDPAAVVVDDHHGEVDAPGGGAEEPVGVVEERHVADEEHRRGGRAERHTHGRRDDPVDAVGPPVGEDPDTVAGRAVPLDVADGHRRRHHEVGPLGQGGQDVTGHAGLGRLGPVGQRPADGVLGAGLGRRPPRAPRRPRPAREAGRQGPAQGGRVGRHRDGRGVLGVDPTAGRIDLHLASARGRQPLGQHLRRRRTSQPEHDRRRVVGREALVAEEVVVRRHRRGQGHPAARRRVGQHGPAGAHRQLVHRFGVARPRRRPRSRPAAGRAARRGRRAVWPRAPTPRRAGGSTAHPPGAPRGAARHRRRAGHGRPG